MFQPTPGIAKPERMWWRHHYTWWRHLTFSNDVITSLVIKEQERKDSFFPWWRHQHYLLCHDDVIVTHVLYLFSLLQRFSWSLWVLRNEPIRNRSLFSLRTFACNRICWISRNTTHRWWRHHDEEWRNDDVIRWKRPESTLVCYCFFLCWSCDDVIMSRYDVIMTHLCFSFSELVSFQSELFIPQKEIRPNGTCGITVSQKREISIFRYYSIFGEWMCIFLICVL